MTDDRIQRERESARKDPRQLELPFYSTRIEWRCGLTFTDRELAKHLSPGPK